MDRLFDYRAIERQRSRSAAAYLSSTELPRRVENELLDRLSILTLEASHILVLGAVRPATLERLCERFTKTKVTITDGSAELLDVLKAGTSSAIQPRVSWRVMKDGVIDPADETYDLVFSNLYVPLFDDLGALFAQFFDILRPGGCLHFSSLGPDSFAELHAAWRQADPESPWHTLVMPDMHDVGDALVHAGFREPVMDRENYTLTYSTAATLMQDLRDHGVGNAFIERRKGLTGRRLWERFVSALDGHRAGRRLALTVELVIGQAWRGDGVGQQRRADGAVGISLEALARGLRGSREGE